MGEQLKRAVAAASIAVLGLQLTGCASMFGTNQQVVTIHTNPPGRTYIIKRNRFADGQSPVIEKASAPPQVNVGTLDAPIMVNLKYKADTWVWGDVGLFIPLILPGVVAWGVDSGSGCWRVIDTPQTINVPESSPLAVPKATPTPSPTPAPTPVPSAPRAGSSKSKSSGSSKFKETKKEPDTAPSPIAP